MPECTANELTLFLGSWASEGASGLRRDLVFFTKKVESRESLTANGNLRMDIFVGTRGLRDAPNREYREKPTVLDVIHADPRGEQLHHRGNVACGDG